MNIKTKSFVKTLHIFFACLWLGASASIVLLQSLMGWSNDIDELAVINRGFTYLDFVLIIPGAMGSALTGIIMCKFTNLGFLRYRWVVTKWSASIVGILVGAVLLGPWQLRMLDLTHPAAGNIVTDAYNSVRLFFSVTGILQVILLIFIITVSIRKPWNKSLTRKTKADLVEPRNA